MYKRNDPFEQLSQIKKVDAPPFLFTRIQQKIDELQTQRFSFRLSWSLGLSFALVVLLDLSVFFKEKHELNQKSTLAQSLNLMPDNTLYK
jgi:hypothetical protein